MQQKNPFSPIVDKANPITPPGSSPVGGGFTAPAYLENRSDEGGQANSPTVPQPISQTGDKSQQAPINSPTKKEIPPTGVVPFSPVDGETPQPTSPAPQPAHTFQTQAPQQFTPVTSAPPVLFGPQAQQQGFTPATPAPAPVLTAAASQPGIITANDPSRPGAGYINGMRIMGTQNGRYQLDDGAGNAIDGGPVNQNDLDAFGKQIETQAKTNGLQFHNGVATDANGNIAGYYAPGQNITDRSQLSGSPAQGWDEAALANANNQANVHLPTGGTASPSAATAARFLIGGSEVGPDGKPIANGYNALSDTYRQQGITPGAINPTVVALIKSNPGLINGLPPEQQAILRNSLASQGINLPANVQQQMPGTVSNGGVATKLGDMANANSSAPNPNSGTSSPVPGSGSGATVGGSSSAGNDNQYGFGNLGSLIEKLLNTPSAFDDKTMQDAIANNEAKLKTSEEEGLAGVDADTAARGLLMGSGNVIDKSKVRDKIQQARGDFNTNITLDRAHTMAQDRAQAFGNAFNFIGAGQNDAAQQFNWAQLAGQLGLYGSPNSNDALGSMGGMPTPDFGGTSEDFWNMLGQMFGGSKTTSAAAGANTKPPMPTNDKGSTTRNY